MGQAEVLCFLSNQRIKGIHKYFTVQEIERGLKDMGCSNGQLKKVGENCLKLNAFNILEYKGEMVGCWKHRKFFRIKSDSVKQ